MENVEWLIKHFTYKKKTVSNLKRFCFLLISTLSSGMTRKFRGICIVLIPLEKYPFNQSVPCMSKAYAASVMDFVEG
jgi:hypothetical protein